MNAKKYFNNSANLISEFITTHEEGLQKIATMCIDCISRGNKLLICGNGGSAADSQHFAAEIVGTFYNKKRKALPAIALTTDTSAITAIGNDLGYEQIFSRQVSGLAQKGDILIVISTSGNSKNCIAAISAAREIDSTQTIGLLGNTGGILGDMCDIALIIPSNDTPLIQQVHLCCYHRICLEIDKYFS